MQPICARNDSSKCIDDLDESAPPTLLPWLFSIPLLNTGALTREYSFDNRGNRATMTVTGAESYTVRYTHDLNNRLLTEERTGQLNRTSVYTHDRNGNQLTRTVENETVVQTCPITGGEISATNWQTETYAYNVFNQLIRVNRPGVAAAYTYRADGLRLTKTVNGATTTHVWLRGSIVLELNAAGNVSNRFVRGSTGRLIRSQHHGWYIINARGDVVQRVNKSGAILRAYHFSAFGMELTPDQSDSNPFRFAGEYWDAETQTYYLRARRFNPRTGRFTQPDPHWGIHNHIFGDSPTMRNDRYMPSVHTILQSSNLFAFAVNNPVRWVDPSGRVIVCPKAVYQAAKEAYQMAKPYLKYVWDGTKWVAQWVQKETAKAGQTLHEYLIRRPNQWLGYQANNIRAFFSAGGKNIFDSLSRSQQKNIEKLHNVINNNLTPGDFSGTLSDLQGNPIVRPGGGFWDHRTEMVQSFHALQGIRRGLEGSLQNPNLDSAVRTFLQNELNHAMYYIHKIEQLFAPFGGI